MNKRLPTYRMCSVTREKLLKEELFRVVHQKSGIISLDLDYSLGGRGAYIKKAIYVIKLGKKRNSLSKSLRTYVDPAIYDLMLQELERK